MSIQKLKIPQHRQRLIFQGKLMKDGTDLSTYKIENMQVVHLVASAAQQQERLDQQSQQQQQQQRVEQQQQQQPFRTLSGRSQNNASSSTPATATAASAQNNGIDLVSEIARTINETNFMRRNRRLIFQQNARQYLQTLNLNQRESAETIRQNILNTRNLIESRISYDQAQELLTENISGFRDMQSYQFESRKIQLGQWIDAKDTIDQWLEAQVVDIRDSQVFIHYNGWGARWDEWIPLNSQRLAPFRSHTVQNPRSNYLSPHPNITPDSNNANLPQTSTDITTIMDDMLQIMTETTNMIREFKQARASSTQQSNNFHQEEEKKQPIIHEEMSSLMEFEEEQKHALNSARQANATSAGSGSGNGSAANTDDQNLRVVFQAAQIAPIVDRMGRMLTDFAPHLNNIVKQHHQRLRDPTNGINVNNNQGLASNEREGLIRENSMRRINGVFAPLESILNNLIRSNSNQPQQQTQNLTQALNNQSLQSQDLRNDSIQTPIQPELPKPIRVQQQVPIMHSPGEISSVANIFDNRLFDEGQDSNIEFHIHAFLSPQQPPATSQQNSGSSSQQQQQQPGGVQTNMQDAQVGPSGLIRNLSSSSLSRTQSEVINSRANTQFTQTPVVQANKETQTVKNETSPLIIQNRQMSYGSQNDQDSSNMFEDQEEHVFTNSTTRPYDPIEALSRIQNPFANNNTQPFTIGQNRFNNTIRSNPPPSLQYRPVGLFGPSTLHNPLNPFANNHFQIPQMNPFSQVPRGNDQLQQQQTQQQTSFMQPINFRANTETNQLPSARASTSGLNILHPGNEAFQQNTDNQASFQGSGAKKSRFELTPKKDLTPAQSQVPFSQTQRIPQQRGIMEQRTRPTSSIQDQQTLPTSEQKQIGITGSQIMTQREVRKVQKPMIVESQTKTKKSMSNKSSITKEKDDKEIQVISKSRISRPQRTEIQKEEREEIKENEEDSSSNNDQLNLD